MAVAATFARVWDARRMKRRVVIAVLAAVFLAAFVGASALLSWHPEPEGVDYCATAGEISTVGQDTSMGEIRLDPEEVAACNAAGRGVGMIGWAVTAIGFAAGAACVLLFRRELKTRAQGEPISRARRMWEPR